MVEREDNPEPYFAIPLWDYAAPSFCSFSKEYFGSFSQIEFFIDKLSSAEPQLYSDVKLAFEKYKRGEQNAAYSVAYQDHILLTPVELILIETLPFPANKWEYKNTWNCIYVLKCNGGEIEQIVVKHNGKYHRCAKAVMHNLYYNVEDGNEKEWLPLNGMFWGHPCMINVEKQLGKKFELHYALYMSEQVYGNKEEAIEDCGDLEKINWSVFGEDIFGDG